MEDKEFFEEIRKQFIENAQKDDMIELSLQIKYSGGMSESYTFKIKEDAFV
jgi:hypothetical protein